MSFTNLLKIKSNISFPSQQIYQTNPIHRINLGLKKGKFYRNNENDPSIGNRAMQNTKQQNQKNVSFRSLSKKKDESLFCKQKQTTQHYQIHSECFSRKNSSQKNLFKDKNIQRKLNFNQLAKNKSQSKEKKLNFAQIIKNSKEKRSVEKSLTKIQKKKAIQPPVKQNSNFTKLKNRLINERSHLDIRQQKNIKNLYQEAEQFDRVRNSIQIGLQNKNEHELDMNPIL